MAGKPETLSQDHVRMVRDPSVPLDDLQYVDASIFRVALLIAGTRPFGDALPIFHLRRTNHLIQHITLPVFHDDGRLATREVLEVEPVATNQYRLLHSPAYIEGIAASDVIELDESLQSGFRLVSRAGNLAVIVVFENPEDKSVQAKRLEESIHTIGGVVDGGPARVLVLTVPVSSGFQVVESLLAAFVRDVPGASWWYGNVYQAGDPSRPLNWWKDGE